MILNYKSICLAFLLVACVSSYYIKPLRAGTIQINDEEIRASKIIKKMVDLRLKQEQYVSHKDTNVIASITSLSMDQNLSFHFGYDIVCPDGKCYLNFTMFRYTEEVSNSFTYGFAADYLVARGLKTKDLNMTFFQEHMFLKDVVSYDQNNQKQDMSKNLPYNNEDAMFMLLFPTGFSNLTLTGHVVYSYILQTDMYVVHYMDHTGRHGEHDSMGWTDKNWIRYRALYLPTDYLSHYQDCIPKQKFQLMQHFQYHCNGWSKVKWFFGFKSTKQASIQGEFFEEKSGFSFSLAKTPTRYGLMAFPFEVDESFIDLRVHEYKWDIEYLMIGTVAGWIISLAAAVGLVVVSVLCIRYQWIKRSRKFKKIGRYDNMHEEVQSEQDTPKDTIQ